MHMLTVFILFVSIFSAGLARADLFPCTEQGILDAIATECDAADALIPGQVEGAEEVEDGQPLGGEAGFDETGESGPGEVGFDDVGAVRDGEVVDDDVGAGF